MTDLYRVRTRFEGFPGGPGVCTMYTLDIGTFLGSLKTFWEGVKGPFPSAVTMTIEGEGDIIDDATGTLTGAWAQTAPALTTGTGGAGYAGPAGGVIRWETATILDGRRLRGRSFLVPLVITAYDTNGTLVAGALTPFATAAGVFIGAESAAFVVWHRPKAAVEDPPAAAVPGGHGLVTSAVIPDKVAVLRSRRDS